MLTEKQFKNIEKKLCLKHCPTCNHQPFVFQEDRCNLFDDYSINSYKEIDETQIKYIHFECPFCGFVMNFNLEKLIR